MNTASVVKQPLTRRSAFSARLKKIGSVLTGVFTVLLFSSFGATAAHAVPQLGDAVYISDGHGDGTTQVFGVWHDENTEGAPIAWAYSVEQLPPPNTEVFGSIADVSEFRGTNAFIDHRSQVSWVMSHSYPALSLEAFAAAAGVPSLSLNDAVEATQYAIWSFTDQGVDAVWPWQTPESEAAYRYLVDAAEANWAASFFATLTAPTEPQAAETLVGPFLVETSEASVRVSTDADFAIVDVDGEAINPDVVVHGQELYIDVRDSHALGSATLNLHAMGVSEASTLVNVPVSDATNPDGTGHAQTLALVSAATTQLSASAEVSWTGEEALTDDENALQDPGSADADDADALEQSADEGNDSEISDGVNENDNVDADMTEPVEAADASTDAEQEPHQDTTTMAAPESAELPSNDLPTTGGPDHTLAAIAALLVILSGIALLVNREKQLEHAR